MVWAMLPTNLLAQLNDVLPMIQAAPGLFVLLFLACLLVSGTAVGALNRRAFKNKETEIGHKNAEISWLKQQKEDAEKKLAAAKAEGEAARENVGRSLSAPLPDGCGAVQVWPDPYRPIAVIGKSFRNERVVLDGHSYAHCTFANVTFVYNGTTPVQLSNNHIQGCWVASDTSAVIGAWALLRGLGFIRDTIGFEAPPGNTVSPPRIARVPFDVVEDGGQISFDYSASNGRIQVGSVERLFVLRFTKASDTAIHLTKHGTNLAWIARVKDAPPGSSVDVEELERSSDNYTIGLNDLFMAQNPAGYVVQGRIEHVADDARGAQSDQLTFAYRIMLLPNVGAGSSRLKVLV